MLLKLSRFSLLLWLLLFCFLLLVNSVVITILIVVIGLGSADVFAAA